MNEPQHIRERLTEHGVEGLRKVPNGRHYAVDLEAATALGSLAMAWRDQLAPGETFTREAFAKEVLLPLSKFVPELVQDRPPAEPELPQMPTDSITGQPIRNPFEKPYDLASQSLLRGRHPLVAQRLEEIAKNGGAPSFAMIVREQDGAAQREKLRALEYGEKEHKSNPFCLGVSKEGLKPQSEFVTKNEPHLIAFYQREATTPIKLSFTHPKNLTATMAIARSDPALHKIVTRAEEIHKEWVAADVQRLEAQVQQHSAQLARTKELASAK